jgi:chloramphenicol 3-O-phosphotransferase
MDRPRQRVVLINGPAGVGKTTVARALAATAANGVCIHGDALKDFVVAREEPVTVETGLSYTGGAALADGYLQGGFELVVFEFVFPTAAQIRRFEVALRVLRGNPEIRLVTLLAGLDIVIEREGKRIGRQPLGGRVTESWNEIATGLDDFAELGAVVRAEGSPAEVLAAVQAALKAEESALQPDQKTLRATARALAAGAPHRPWTG